jgi:biopolymer transport protein ExbB/TolQ
VSKIYRLAAYAGEKVRSTMNLGALLQSAIYLISSSMLYPAMFLLVAGFAAAVVGSGAAVADWAERSLSAKRKASNCTNAACVNALEELEDILRKSETTWDDVEFLWQNARLKGWKKLDYLRILARLGPAMGLVGTLIPMSTGLASLSQGDTSRLSSDLVVAFSTTVVGLCSGVTAYILHTVKSRWLEGDLQTLQMTMEARATKAFNGEREKNGENSR